MNLKILFKKILLKSKKKSEISVPSGLKTHFIGLSEDI